MWRSFHKKYNFVLLNPFINNELSIFFSDLYRIASLALFLLAESELSVKHEWGVFGCERSHDKIGDHFVVLIIF